MFATRACLLGVLATACAWSAPASAEPYFRPGTFGTTPDDHDFAASWYSTHLRALREPSLVAQARDSKAHTYRFLWLRAFDPPIALRLDVSADGTGTLTVKATSGNGGYQPGTLVTSWRRVIPRTEVGRFLSLLATARYWELPTSLDPLQTQPDGSITITTDGAHWILEAVRSGRHHVVDRHNPERGAYREAALWLLRRSGLWIEPENIY